MADRRVIFGCRRLYGLLLRFYPRTFRDRFAEGMQQTFHDMCRERAAPGRGFTTFVLGAFADTLIGIAKERLMTAMAHRSRLVRPLLVTLAILAIPFVAMATGADVEWSGADFVVGFGLLFGSGLALEFLTARARGHAHRVATAFAILTLLLLVWTNLAVGLIGAEGHPANALSMLVLAVVVIGSIVARLRPRPMTRVMSAATVAQALVPAIAWIVWTDELTASPGATMNFLPSAFFVLLFALGALLFHRASDATRATVRPS